MKVYGLYYGCRFEGGNVCCVYGTIDKALEDAQELLKHEREEDIRVLDEDKWEEVEDTRNPSIIKIWQSDLDEIIIYEYEVK